MGVIAKTTPTTAAPTKVCTLIKRAEDEADKSAIRNIMTDLSYPHRKIAAWLGCSSSTISEHRAKHCPECCGGDAA